MSNIIKLPSPIKIQDTGLAVDNSAIAERAQELRARPFQRGGSVSVQRRDDLRQQVREVTSSGNTFSVAGAGVSGAFGGARPRDNTRGRGRGRGQGKSCDSCEACETSLRPLVTDWIYRLNIIVANWDWSPVSQEL